MMTRLVLMRVDLRTNRRHNRRFKDVQIVMRRAIFSIDAELWRKTVHEVFDGDTLDRILPEGRWLQPARRIGMVMFICHGAGANGKPLLETIREVVGTYGQTVPVQLMSGKSNSGGANPEIARLRGVRFVSPLRLRRVNAGLRTGLSS